MSEKETEDVEKKIVFYRYGDKGGLRYYAIDYKEYLKIFGDICYINMDIESNNQMTFQYFIDKIAPKSESVWLKEKYSVISEIPLNEMFSIGKDFHNCQTFASKALKLLKPIFKANMIVVTDKSRTTENKIDIFPDFMIKVLQNLN